MSTLTIDIRHAEPEDAVAIAETHRAAWSHAYSGILPYKALRHMLERRDIGLVEARRARIHIHPGA
jgi:hypothetical protein